MKRILSMVMMIVITVTSFGFCSYNSNSVVSADTVSWPSGPGLVAETAVMIDASTGSVLFDKKCHQKMYPASITKIMTALLTIENCNLDDTVTFSQSAIDTLEPEAANIGAVVGEEISVKDCLYALMLQSANEVASALAEHVSGSIEEFAKLMNKRAKQAGANDAHFANACGLFNKKHYVTAYDMAKIMQAALQYPVFREIINSSSYTLPTDNKRKEPLTISQRHQMVQPWNSFHYDGIIGGKTGFVNESGTTLVTSAQRDGMTLITVVLNSPGTNSYVDTTALLDFGFKNFKLTNVSENDTRFENKSTFTNNFDSIFKNKLHRLSLSKDAVVVLPKDANFADTTSTITLNEDSSDDNNTVATISYSYGDHTIGTAPVLYSEVSNKISVNATVTPEESTTVDTETSVDSENSNNSSKFSDKDTTKKTTKKETVSKSHFKFSSAIFKIIIIAVILVILAVIIIFFKKKMDHLNAVRASKRRRNR